MTTAVLDHRVDFDSLATRVLNRAVRFWFVTAVIGQWAFFYYIAALSTDRPR